MKMSASVEMMNPILLNYYKYYIDKNDYLHFLSHPKFLTPMSLRCLDNFLTHISKKHIITDLIFE